MNIDPSQLSGQLAAEVYQQFLSLVKREMSQRPDSRHCDWRFHPPQRPPQAEAALRTYWGEVFKHQLEALDAEWSNPRPSTPITDGTEAQDALQAS